MKKAVFFISLTFMCISLYSQITPVKWSYEAKKLENGQYELVFQSEADNGWYIYSQFIEEGGPIPTSFTFEEDASFKAVGKIKEEGNKKEGYDQFFDMKLIKFTGTATFTQKIEYSGSSKKINGFIEFMTCNDQQCLPPTEIPFEFNLN